MPAGPATDHQDVTAPSTAPAAIAPSDGPIERPTPRRLPVGALPAVVLVVLGVLGALGRDVWLDEAYSLAATVDIGTALDAGNGSMGLYYVVLEAWTTVSDDTLWVRLLSILAMAAAVVVFARVVERQHGRTVALAAAAGAVACHATVHYAFEARSYALVCLVTAVVWSALDRLVRDPDDRRALAVIGVGLAVLPALHGTAALTVPIVAGTGLMCLPAGPPRRRLLVAASGGALVTTALLAIGAGESGGWLPALSVASARSFLAGLVLPAMPFDLLVLVATATMTAILVRRGLRSTGSDRLSHLMPVAWGPALAVGVLAISTVRPTHLTRYAVSAVFGLVLVLVLGATELDRRRTTAGRDRALPLAATALAALLAIGGLAATLGAGPDWSGAARLVETSGRTGDVVVFPTDDARMPFDAAWRERDRTVDPEVLTSPHPLGALRRRLDPPTLDQLVASLDGADRVWVVTMEYMHVPNPDLLGDQRVDDSFRTDGTWELDGGIEVTLLVREGS